MAKSKGRNLRRTAKTNRCALCGLQSKPVKGLRYIWVLQMGQHIIRRQAVYHYRRVVPEAIRNIIGKREITKSLNTKDRREAEKAARKYGVQVDELFEQALASLERVRTSGTVGHATMQEHEWGQDEHELEQDSEADRVAALLDDSPAPVGRNDSALLEYHALMLKARATLPRRSGNGKAGGANDHTFMDALAHWQTTRKPGGAAVAQAHRSLSKFWEISGRRLLPCEVERAHVAQFVRKLAESGIAPGTVRHYVTFIKALLSAAVDAGYIGSNPALKIATPPVSSRKPRVPFTVDEVQTILRASAGLQEAAQREPQSLTGFKYWAPRIALYTGMRLEEIGQLAPGDIRVEHGCALVYVTEDEEGQHLKTGSKSMRRIPLHNELLPLVEIAKCATGTQIWPLKPNANGRRTGTFSGKWNKWLRSIGVPEKRKTFHSFRHLLKDTLREHGVSEETSDAITGHAGGNRVSRGYGAEYYPVKPLRAAIATLPTIKA
ncbi:site-specific integrase [Paraburkholderia mimosarum]|uniref:site-specific integrase n=1 Tax=Paraburkholderia mimosarum TaxID=312026 RepID=UPI0004282687|nr:site-specific integrase [Paraburkholderia mimosarum]